ncbi:hypothetical protein BH09ACT10_BH09ACT10_07900 [soil metagenome]
MIAAAMSGALVAAAVFLWRPSGRSIAAHRISWPGRASNLDPRRLALPLALVAAALAMTRLGSLRHVLLAATAVGIALCARQLRGLRRAARARDLLRAETSEALDALIAELAAGTPASIVLSNLTDDWPVLAPAASAARLGGDVPSAMRYAARRPGAESLTALAAAWEVSERSGASQTLVLERLGDALLDQREVRREVLALLGPTRATARLLAVLPILGIALGSGMGSSPLHILSSTFAGAVCLAVGSAFACTGLVWVERIAHRAEAR